MADAILEKASSPSGSPKDKLYEIMTQKPPGHIFFQHDLTGMGVAGDIQNLRAIIQDLASAQLVQIMMHDGEVCYRARSRIEASRLNDLSSDEHIIYNYIAESTTNGCWVKALKAKTNMHAANLGKVIKSLENKRFIKTIKNVKFPTRRIYMLSELNPSEEITGGPWFSDAELDLDLVEALADLAIKFISDRSWGVTARKKPRKDDGERQSTTRSANTEKDHIDKDGKINKPAKQPKKGKQADHQSPETTRQATEGNHDLKDNPRDISAAASAPVESQNTNATANDEPETPYYPPQPNLHPIPPSLDESTSSFPSSSFLSSHDYPTTAEICAHIRDSRVTSLSFSEAEFQDLLDMLVWDGRLEKMGPRRYRSVRGVLALSERAREQERRRKEREKMRRAAEADIEDLGAAPPAGDGKKRKRAHVEIEDDEDGKDDEDDVVLGGRDWKKFHRLHKRQAPSSKNQASKGKVEASAGGDTKPGRGAVAVVDDDPPDPEFGGLTNGFAEAPCSRCPVASICGEDGPVSAATCPYFEAWLGGGMKEYEGHERQFQKLDKWLYNF